MVTVHVTPGFNRYNPVHWLAFGFASGFLRPAPGTWGTAAAIPLWYYLSGFSQNTYVAATIVIAIVAVIFCDNATMDVRYAGGQHDDPSIVLDEWVGFLVTMAFLPVSWLGLALGFGFFRLFDAVKRGPVGWVDTYTSGGFGIVADDVVAGLLAGLSALAVLTLLG